MIEMGGSFGAGTRRCLPRKGNRDCEIDQVLSNGSHPRRAAYSVERGSAGRCRRWGGSRRWSGRSGCGCWPTGRGWRRRCPGCWRRGNDLLACYRGTSVATAALARAAANLSVHPGRTTWTGRPGGADRGDHGLRAVRWHRNVRGSAALGVGFGGDPAQGPARRRGTPGSPTSTPGPGMPPTPGRCGLFPGTAIHVCTKIDSW